MMAMQWPWTKPDEDSGRHTHKESDRKAEDAEERVTELERRANETAKRLERIDVWTAAFKRIARGGE